MKMPEPENPYNRWMLIGEAARSAGFDHGAAALWELLKDWVPLPSAQEIYLQLLVVNEQIYNYAVMEIADEIHRWLKERE